MLKKLLVPKKSLNSQKAKFNKTKNCFPKNFFYQESESAKKKKISQNFIHKNLKKVHAKETFLKFPNKEKKLKWSDKVVLSDHL
jgi:hypothetical protein